MNKITRISMAFIISVITLLVFGTSTLSAANTAWQASYWNNRTLSGSPVLQRTENDLNHNWGHNAPDALVNKDNFSARWVRTLNVAAGSYRFTATTDDGMRVWVDNVLLIDSWIDSQERTLSNDIYLNAGDHQITVEYYEAGGTAVAKLNWAPLNGSTPQPVLNWKGQYFNNTSLSGTPVLERDDKEIDFDWGVGSPLWGTVASDQFSARWTRNLVLEPGRYRFFVTADDGVRLWVNGRLLVDEWHEAGLITYEADIDLGGGSIPVQMEYFENQGGSVARLRWLRVGGGGKWRGEYFNNRHVAGSPNVVREDAQIDFQWGNGAPAAGINADNFSVRWSRSLNLSAGRYRFTAVADDGVQVWVNGQLIINAWRDQMPTTISGEIDLPSGNIPVVVTYYDATGGSQIKLSWTAVSQQAPAPVPSQPVPGIGSGTVISERLNVRTGPGLQYGVMYQLARGQAVSLAGYRSVDANWVMITQANGKPAWVSGRPAYLQTNVVISNLPVWQGSQIEQPPVSGNSAVVGNAYYLNLRSGPGTSNPVISVIPAGSVVQMLGRNSNASWIRVQLANGRVGWVSGSFLINHPPFTTLPVVN